MQCYDIGGDEIMAKLKQFFKQYFIYICLVAACLSLVSANLLTNSLCVLTHIWMCVMVITEKIFHLKNASRAY